MTLRTLGIRPHGVGLFSSMLVKLALFVAKAGLWVILHPLQALGLVSLFVLLWLASLVRRLVSRLIG